MGPLLATEKPRKTSSGVPLALLPVAVVVCVRAVSPDWLDSNDQAKQALYVLDIRENGRWILPFEMGVAPATKPPLYAWLGTLASLALGPTELACRLPSALASLAVTWLLYIIASERSGPRAGLAAAWMLPAMHPFMRLSIHVRPDMILALLTTSALYALHRMESAAPDDRKRAMQAGALTFWSAVSLSVLAKGFPGPLVAAGGLAALCLDRGWRSRVGILLRSPWVALLGLPLAWFGLALMAGGETFWSTIVKEVTDRAPVGRALDGTRWNPPGQLIVMFLARCAPWSIIAVLGIGLGLARGRGGGDRSVVLPAAWFLGGLVIFSLFKGQRQDYLLPFLPPAALIAAGALAGPRPPVLRRAWDSAMAAMAAAAALLSVPALLGLPPGAPAWMASATSRGGAIWGSSLLGASAVLSWAVLAARRRNENGLLGIRFFAAAAAAIIVLSGYTMALSPDARKGTGGALREMARIVNAERRRADDVVLFGPVSKGLRFLTGLTDPSSTLEEIESRWGPSREGRLLVLTDVVSVEELGGAVPGKMSVLASRPQNPGAPGVVLLEVLPGVLRP